MAKNSLKPAIFCFESSIITRLLQWSTKGLEETTKNLKAVSGLFSETLKGKSTHAHFAAITFLNFWPCISTNCKCLIFRPLCNWRLNLTHRQPKKSILWSSSLWAFWKEMANTGHIWTSSWNGQQSISILFYGHGNCLMLWNTFTRPFLHI